MARSSRKNSVQRHFAHFSSSTGPGKPLPFRKAAISTVKHALREGFEIELRINGYQTIVRGGDVDRVFAMLERCQIGAQVS